MTARSIGDPSDKVAIDAAADGQFQAVNRRAGYGDADRRTAKVIEHAEKGHTLAAGEGELIVARLRAAEADALAWQRRFNTIRAESTFIERQHGQQPWLRPDARYRAMDMSGVVFYGDSPEEATDALADYWDEYHRYCEAQQRDQAGAQDHMDGVVPGSAGLGDFGNF